MNEYTRNYRKQFLILISAVINISSGLDSGNAKSGFLLDIVFYLLLKLILFIRLSDKNLRLSHSYGIDFFGISRIFKMERNNRKIF